MSVEVPDKFVFYCPQHRLRFRANGDTAVVCEQGGHTVGYGFPNHSWWEYCCDCATFWPSPSSNGLRQSECLVCERPTTKRYVCPRCQVVSIESAALVLRKQYSITAEQGILPHCPGCGQQNQGALSEHECREIAASILTQRQECPFCEQVFGESTAPAPPTILEADEGDSQTETPAEDDNNASSAALHIPSWQATISEAPPKRRVSWKPVVATLALTVIIVITLAVFLSSRRTVLTPGSQSLPTPPSGMVYIQGAQFTMGNDLGDEYEKPAHRVTVNSFFLDVYEVTNEEYERFVKATGHKRPSAWNGTYPSGAARQPVVGVDWYDARDYASWAKKRLPTEEEWEFAARGTDGRIYPWGNEWKSNAANAGESSAGQFTNVGSYPDGKSPFGVMDLIGNAWEWTSSGLQLYPGSPVSRPPAGDRKIIRGASWLKDDPPDWTVTYRGFALPSGGKDYSKVGFRCAADVAPPPTRN